MKYGISIDLAENGLEGILIRLKGVTGYDLLIDWDIPGCLVIGMGT